MRHAAQSSRSVLRGVLVVAATACIAGAPALPALAAQTPSAGLDGVWQVTFPSDAVRYVNGERVPVGSETWRFAIVRHRGDSAVATWTSAEGLATDTLRGAVRDGRWRFVFDPRAAIARPAGIDGADVAAPMLSGTLEFSVRDGAMSGTLVRGVRPPGASAPVMFPPAPVTGSRVASPGVTP